MRRRTLATLLAVTAVIAFVAILPRTPPGRAWLLGRLTAALDRSGITLRYRHASGDLWAGVELDGAQVRAPGASFDARTLRIDYFLPSLITGDLPLSVTVAGLRGSVDVGKLPRGTKGAGLPIRPRLQELTVSDASVSVQQVPYTIPSGAVSHVSIHQQGSALQVDAQLSTADGSADVTGTLDLAARRFDGQVVQADVSLARHWFPGATGGSVSGPLHAGPNGVRADLTLQGGALDAIGLKPHGIHGTVELRYPLVRADVQGTVLGGDVSAQGVVNIAARHWTAHAHGNSQLLATASWLARNSLPAGSRLPLHGSATATLDASGWKSVHLSGSAGGSGSFAGLPLSELQADFSFDTNSGVKVQATGHVAGGAAVLSAVTGPDATTVDATARKMSPLPGQTVDLQAHLALAASGPSGSVHVVDAGTLGQHPFSLTLDGGLNSDGWQAVIQGKDDHGASLEGAAALSGGMLSGEVRLHDLTVPGLQKPLAASLRADGKLTALPLTLELGDGTPVRLAAGGERVQADLSGTVKATLAGGRLRQVAAALGPLSVSGDVALAPLAGRLKVQLAPVAVSGPASGVLAVEQGRLAFGPGAPSPQGTLHLTSLAAGPVRFPDLTLDLAPPASGTGLVTATAADQRLQITLAGDRLQARLHALPLSVAGIPTSLDGSASVPLGSHPLRGLDADLSAVAHGGTLALRGKGTALATTLTAPAGTGLGPVTLTRALRLSGTLDAAAGSGAVDGSLGDVPLHGTLSLRGAPAIVASAGANPDPLTLALNASGWHARGDLALDPLAKALGLPVRGTLQADLARGPGGYRGEARVDATAPLAGQLRLRGAGASLDASLTSSLLGQRLTASGTLMPVLALRARAGALGPVTLQHGRLSGSGSLASQALGAGVSLAPLDWSVRGSLSPLSVDLALGQHGSVHLDAAAGPRLAADLRLPLRFAGRSLTLVAATAGGGPPLPPTAKPAVSLRGGLADLTLSARLLGPAGDTLASAHGTPASLAVQGTVQAAFLASRLPAALAPAGALSFRGNAHLTSGRRIHLDTSWTAASDTLTGTLTSSTGGTDVSLHGAGLSIEVAPGQATLTANAVELAPLFPALPAAAVLDGALSRRQGNYSGVLDISADIPAGGGGTLSGSIDGEGARLAARLSGGVGPLTVQGDGTLLPVPDLHARLSAWGGTAVLSADGSGPWSRLSVTGNLTTRAVAFDPWLRLPSRSVSVQLQPGSGTLSASGDGVDLRGTLADVHGNITLPLLVLGSDESVQARLSGPLISPRMQAALRGPLSGTVSGGLGGGLAVDVTVAKEALARLAPLPAGRLAGDAAVTGTLRASGAWQAHIAAAAALAGRRLPLRASLEGTGADYSGNATLSLAAGDAGPAGQPGPKGAGSGTPPGATASELAATTFTGSGTRLRAAVDLAGVDFPALGTLLGVPLQVDATGALDLTTAPLSANLRIDASGSAAGRAIALHGHAGQGTVALDGSYGGVRVDASGTGAGAVSLHVSAPQDRVTLQGDLAVGSDPHLTLTGTLAGAPASLDIRGDLVHRSGSLRAGLGKAALDASVARSGSGLELTATARAPRAALAPVGVPLSGTLALDATLAHGEAALKRLDVELSGLPAPVSTSLSGALYPTADVAGTVSVPSWKVSGDLTLAGPPTSLRARLGMHGFSATASVQGRKLVRLTAEGKARVAPMGRALDVDAHGFAWTAARGFAGRATVTLPNTPAALPGPVSASLSGDGALRIRSQVGPGGAPWATLDARLAADPTGSDAWQGGVRLSLPVASLAGLPAQAKLALTGTPAITGSLLDPALQGPVALAGAVTADGHVAWRRGNGRLTFSGPSLALTADLRGSAWHGNATLHDVALAPFAPAARGASASLQADLQGGAGQSLDGSLSGLRIQLPGVVLTGNATVHDGLRAALQVSADLASMQLPGPPLAGVVHGPLVLAAPDLSHLGQGTVIAQLDVAHLGPQGVKASVDGSLQIGGSPTRPVLSAELQGTGAAHGQLRASAALAARRLDVHSTLGYDDLATDLNITLHDGTVEASGDAAFGRAKLQVSTAPDGELALAGSGALAGWQATVPASLDRASLSGPLAGLGAGTRGKLTLSVGGSPWLDGAVKGAVVGGVTLGDVSVSSQAPTAPIHLAAEHLHARLDPTSLDWSATLNAQPLPGGPRVRGTANGHALTGDASLTLGGDLGGRPLDVTLQASRRQGIRVEATGTLAAGTFAAHVTRPSGSGWQGTVTLADATLGGVTASLHGTVSGAAGAAPALDGNVTLQGALSGTATVHAAATATRVTAELGGPLLAGGLDAKGTLTPALDLTLSSTGVGGGRPQSLRLYQANGAVRADGALQMRTGPAAVSLSGKGAGGPVQLGLRVPAVPGLAFQGTLPTLGPRALVTALATRGLMLTGTAATSGHLDLQAAPTPQASVEGVSLRVASLALSVSGSATPSGAALKGSLTLPRNLPVDALGGTAIPFAIAWRPGHLTLTSDGATGRLQAQLDPASGQGRLTADMHTLGATPGTASVDVSFAPNAGATGQLKVAGVRVSRPDLPGLTVGAAIQLGSGSASGTIDVTAPHGGLHASGTWGLADLLPPAFAPTGTTGGNAELRVSTFDLTSLPTLQRLVPHLAGSASGVVRLRDRTVVGELVVPDLRVASTTLPLDVQVSGTLGSLDAHAKLGATVATATLEPGSVKGLLQLQSFPAQVLAEAVTGSTDVRANVDGVLRFDVPFRHPAAAYLRMATQRVTLERAGVETTGNVSWVYNDRSFTVEQAAFQGRGSWHAKGTIDPNTLDMQLSATEADFTPLLGLVPAFARYGVGASGSFSLDAQGSPADPNVTLSASGLEARVAGTHYRLQNVRAALKGQALSAAGHIVGVAPLGGSVDAKGSATLTLAPLAIAHTDFTFTGSAELPVVGTVTDLSGGITQQAGRPPQLALSGKLGNPFTVRGSLSPFDVTVKGRGLDLKARPLFVTSSTVDADVRVKGTGSGLSIGGELDASEVHMNIGAPSAPGQPATGSSPQGTAAGGASGGQASTAANGGAAGSPGAPPTAGTTPSGQTASSSANGGASADQAASAARASVVFDHLHLKAPQRVLLAAGFGNAEASLDLTLTGTAAAPKLDGEARALRGTLTFAGRDFTIDQATATFQASRGTYPSLDVTAHTEFDKQRVLGSSSDVTFAAPRDSNTFQVTLAFSGQVRPATQGPSPVRFDIQPTLSSNAMVQTTSDTGTSSPRPLSDSELLSLVTLGRLGVTPQLAGQSAFGAAVAQSALDTAVNVLVVSELQNALSKALGIDVVQIQTTPISGLIQNNGQPFGVSLRLGGYLTPQLFASYRLGNYNGASGAFGFSNEVNLSYAVGPLNFDLSGRLSFPDATPALGAVPELGVGIRYAFTNNLGLEAGIDLSDVRKQATFGVSVHW